MRNGIEVGLEIRVIHRLIPGLNMPAYLLQRLVCRAPRTKPIGAILKIRFEDRLQDQQGRHLHHSVAHRRDDQRELHLSPVRLWDGLRSVILSILCAASASKYSRNDA